MNLKNSYERFVTGLQNRDTREVLGDLVVTAEQVQKAVNEPGIGTIFAACMSVARTLTGAGVHYYDAFDGELWEDVVPREFTVQATEALKPHITGRERLGGCSTCIAYYIEAEGASVAWALDEAQPEHSYTSVKMRASHAEASKAFVRRALWGSAKSNRLVLESIPKGEQQLRVVADDDSTPSHSSQMLSDLVPYLKKCAEQGVPRSILVHGSPGTGKTTVVQSACDALGIRSVRIRAENIASLTTEAFEAVISAFTPDAVIFDDLDRSSSQVALFEVMALLSRRVKYVFATVNYPDRLDGALKRPGRFDEIIELEELDPEAVKAILGEYGDAFEAVRHWPVAYIREYTIRRRLLGREKALAALEELQKRATKLGGGDE